MNIHRKTKISSMQQSKIHNVWYPPKLSGTQRDKTTWPVVRKKKKKSTNSELMDFRISRQEPLIAQLVKSPPAMQETWFDSWVEEDPLEKGKGKYSSLLQNTPVFWPGKFHGLSNNWATTKQLSHNIRTIVSLLQGSPWWSSSWESTFQRSGHGLNPYWGN